MEHVHTDKCIGMYEGKYVCEMDREELLKLVAYLSGAVRYWEKATFDVHDLLAVSVTGSCPDSCFVREVHGKD